MKFVHNKRFGEWKTKVTVFDREIELAIDNQVSQDEQPSFGESVLSQIKSNWSQIQAKLVDSLLKKYNSAWADPSEGLPKLTAKKFLAEIHLRSVRVGFVDEQQCLSLSFDPGDLFAGHGIGLFWELPDKMYGARIEG